uniref:Uncharacterized protein n=1 Tax=Phytophthora ramorum TaxID=164328 RepID=H3HCP7_PHYRM
MSLLRLLKSEPLWFFLRLMAERIKTEESSSRETTELLNRLAKVLNMFTLDEHFLVLRDVIREALGDALTLGDVVGVLSLFPAVTMLLEFLRYVNGFTKYARSCLLFRVLAKYQQPAFIFEMCRILDLDDAVFALKRLDRMWQRRHVELDKAMETLARLFNGGNVQVKDDFCDLIVGFKGLSAALDEEKVNGSAERIVTPRTIDSTPDSEVTSDFDDDDNPDSPLRLPSATPPSHQPVPTASQQQHPPRARTTAPPNNVFLSRSESAPATLTFENDSEWAKQKRSRGVAAALDNPPEFHVGRDKGADFLQKQRQRVFEEKVMLAKAAQLRECTPQGFITEPPVRGQTQARHH